MHNKSKVIKTKWNQKSSQKASWITVQLHAWLLNCEPITLNTDKIKILMDTQNKTNNLIWKGSNHDFYIHNVFRYSSKLEFLKNTDFTILSLRIVFCIKELDEHEKGSQLGWIWCR